TSCTGSDSATNGGGRAGQSTPADRAPETEGSGLTLAQAADRYLASKARKRTIEADRRQLELLKVEFGGETPWPRSLPAGSGITKQGGWPRCGRSVGARPPSTAG